MSSKGSIKKDINKLNPLADYFEKESDLNNEQKIAASFLDENNL
tara:strand:- start:629 stop:760 length:132 start_codon:yes stop_codon:yes gene_type:complete